jgi:hypothetical protein
MMYRVPMPTKSNGVKIKMLGDHEVGIQYTKGVVPHVSKMAYDSAYGITSKITFRRARPDYEAIVADAVRQVDREDAMPKAGKPPIGNNDMKTDTNMEYDDDASKVIGQLMDYLEKFLTPDQMEGVVLILSSGDAPDNDAGEPHNYQAADRRRGRQAADQARRRPMSGSTENAYLRLFPHANRLA